ncbi:hypothetical protein JW859_09835 [bacterium]|nr:hypothetical protein [bacterium]
MGQGQSGDPTILDWWFRRQTRAWARQWRWLLVLTAVLAITSLMSNILYQVSDFLLIHAEDSVTLGFLDSTVYKVFRYIDRNFRTYLHVISYLKIFCVSILLTSYMPRLLLPKEIATVASIKQVFRRTLYLCRSHSWTIVLLLVIGPIWLAKVTELSLRCWVYEASYSSLACSLSMILAQMGIWLIIIECLLALLLRRPYKAANYPLFLMPVIMYTAFYALWQSGLPVNVANYALDGRFTPIPNADDIWIAVAHVALTLGGMVLAAAWWPRVIQSASLKGWWSLFGFISFSLVLPGIFYCCPNLWLSRIVYAMSALGKGVWLGNPVAGWSIPLPLYWNPYYLDSQLVSSASHCQQLNNLDWNAYNWISSDPHVVLGPYIYVPASIALLWYVFYYAYSIAIIWRANNRVPEGFRGTWEQ